MWNRDLTEGFCVTSLGGAITGGGGAYFWNFTLLCNTDFHVLT